MNLYWKDTGSRTCSSTPDDRWTTGHSMHADGGLNFGAVLCQMHGGGLCGASPGKAAYSIPWCLAGIGGISGEGWGALMRSGKQYAG